MLNRCPSCQASVLDDDAEVCPFCGSPMDPAKAKGFKPAAAPVAKAPAPQAPAATSSPPSKPDAQEAKKPSAAAKPAPALARPAVSGVDDDPFALDRKTGSGAVALSPKRTQQRPHKVVCPMCDTAGYANEAASGKDVRCANPKCLVPVFKSPDFAAPKPPEPEPKPSALNPTALTFGAVGVILSGAALWWFVLREPPAEQPGGPMISGATSVPDPRPTDAGQAENVPQTPAAPAPLSAAEVLAAALGRWPQIANDVAQPQRQPLRRRYAAESFAIAGRAELAREQIDRLAATRSADADYRIPPLAELAWANLKAGDEAAAKAAFDQAAPLVTEIPRQGFDPARVAIDWSAAAARFGQADAARETARTPRDDAAGEQLLSLLYSASLFSGGDVDREFAARPVRPSGEPKTLAVTYELLRRGSTDLAKQWAEGFVEPAARAECLAAWAEAMAKSGATPDSLGAAIDGAGTGDPSVAAYVQARAAVRLALRDGGKPAAEALLSRFTQTSASFPAPAAPVVPETLQVYRAEAADPLVPVRAYAFAEAAHAAAVLGRTEEATGFLAKASDQLRASAPSPAAVARLRAEFDGTGIAGMQRQLKAALSLSNDDQARQAANDYRRNLQDLEGAAARRFDAQTELLVRAIGWGLGPHVLAEAQRRNTAEDAAAQEAYLKGPAGGRLLAAFRASAEASALKSLGAAGVTDRDVPINAALEAVTVTVSEEKREAFNRDLFSDRWSRAGRTERQSVAIRMACRLVTRQSAAGAISLAAAVRDAAAREEVLRYASICAARAGKGGEVLAQLPKLRLPSTEEAAVLRGLTEGAVAAGGAAAAPSVPPADPAPPAT